MPGGRLGHYSFLGADPYAIARVRGRELWLEVRRDADLKGRFYEGTQRRHEVPARDFPDVVDLVGRRRRRVAEHRDAVYAELGQRVGLSAAAAHERVKQLRCNGVIEATVAVLNGQAIGRPVAAFVHVNTRAWATQRRC